MRGPWALSSALLLTVQTVLPRRATWLMLGVLCDGAMARGARRVLLRRDLVTDLGTWNHAAWEKRVMLVCALACWVMASCCL